MSKYLFIESGDPFDSSDVTQTYGLIKKLGSEGHDVKLFLVQNGTLVTRKSSKTTLFHELLGESNIKVYADDYSLEERGIMKDDISNKIEIAGSDVLVDVLMEDDRRPIWH